MSKYTVVSSEGNSLNFVTQEEYDEYQKDELELFKHHHSKLKNKYGIWASNQNRYVDSIQDLNDWDSRLHITAEDM